MKHFFHLGYHKTGSTHLQDQVFRLCKDADLITRPHTVLYEAFGKLKFALDADYDKSELVNLLHTLFPPEKNRNLIISDETLLGAPSKNYLNRPNIISRLAEIDSEAHVIVFIRGQLDLIESLYNQYIKVESYKGELNELFIALNNAGLSPDEHEKYEFDNSPKLDMHHHPILGWMDVSRFKYTSLIDDLHRHFKHVHIFLYEDLLHDPASVYARLGDIMGETSIAEFTPKKSKINPRLKGSDLWIRLMSARIKTHFPNINRWFRVPLARTLAFLFGKKLQRRKEHYLSRLRNEAGFGEDNRKANEKYKLGMEKYANKYLLD